MSMREREVVERREDERDKWRLDRRLHGGELDRFAAGMADDRLRLRRRDGD
jgi:hypothetical protein